MYSGRYLLLLAALTALIPTLQPANLRAQTAHVDTRSAPSPRRLPIHETQKEKMNAWTVGLAGGPVVVPYPRLLQSLPENGHIAVRISVRGGAAQDGRFSLGGLNPVREKLAAACKWPSAVARPHN